MQLGVRTLELSEGSTKTSSQCTKVSPSHVANHDVIVKTEALNHMSNQQPQQLQKHSDDDRSSSFSHSGPGMNHESKLTVTYEEDNDLLSSTYWIVFIAFWIEKRMHLVARRSGDPSLLHQFCCCRLFTSNDLNTVVVGQNISPSSTGKTTSASVSCFQQPHLDVDMLNSGARSSPSVENVAYIPPHVVGSRHLEPSATIKCVFTSKSPASSLRSPTNVSGDRTKDRYHSSLHGTPSSPALCFTGWFTADGSNIGTPDNNNSIDGCLRSAHWKNEGNYANRWSQYCFMRDHEACSLVGAGDHRKRCSEPDCCQIEAKFAPIESINLSNEHPNLKANWGAQIDTIRRFLVLCFCAWR